MADQEMCGPARIVWHSRGPRRALRAAGWRRPRLCFPSESFVEHSRPRLCFRSESFVEHSAPGCLLKFGAQPPSAVLVEERPFMAAKAIPHTTVTLSAAPPKCISIIGHWREVEGPRQGIPCHADAGVYPDFL